MPNQNQQPNDPELIDVLNLLKKDIMLNLSAHHVGIIESFSILKQTAEVRIAYTQTHFKPNAVTGSYEPTYVDYPILLDCPVVFFGGGGLAGGSLTFPVAKGDECLVLFNDRDIDNWFQGTGSTSPASLRLHSISDGFALVGIRSLSNVIKNFSNDKVQLRFGDTKAILSLEADRARLGYGADVEVSTKASKILVKNSSKNLGEILTRLIDKLTDLDTAINKLVSATSAMTFIYSPGPGGPTPTAPPVNAAAISAVTPDINAVTSALATIKADLGALLE